MSDATAPTQPPVRRQSSVDQQTAIELTKRLQSRPDKTELIEKNILKNDNVAPALQAAKEKLQRSQLEASSEPTRRKQSLIYEMQDKLDHALAHRPKPEELIREGILTQDELPTV